MFKNYFIIAFRNFSRNKVYSAINIIGLSIGLAVCMLIILYTAHEHSYDKFHANADRIFGIEGKIKMGSDSIFMNVMSFALAPAAKQHDPNIESFVRFNKVHPNVILENPKSASLKFAEADFLFADSNFFRFFSFKLLKGNASNVLKSPFSIVISEKAAKKYFGETNPVGQVLRYNNNYYFTVTGVAEKVPSNSSIDFEFVASLSSMAMISEQKKQVESQLVQFGSFITYFMLRQPKDYHQLEATLIQLHKSTTNEKGDDETYFAAPITDTHLDSNFSDYSNLKYLFIFPFVAALVLLLALINYMSLSTARATQRAKEIGVRKVMGADRKTIATQFFVESALFTSVAFALGYILCTILQPAFFNFLQIDVDRSFLHSPAMLFSYLGLLIVTVTLAATYPSIVLSAFMPVMVLYGKFSKNSGGINVRRFFTVFQFTMSIALIICGIVIEKQMYFFRHKDTGVNRENIVMVAFDTSIGKHYAAFKKETQSLAAISQVSTAHYPMYKGYDIFYAKANHTNNDVALPILTVDENFIPMLGLKWLIHPPDSLYYLKGEVIINETAIEKLNLGNNPLNESINLGGRQVHVAGVLKDFNYQSLENKIDALSLFTSQDNDTASGWGEIGGCLFARIKPQANTASVIGQIGNIYKKYEQAKPFEYHFMDDSFEAMYKAEDRLAKISVAFVVITLLIASLGLLGLATFMAERRTKEIGIRKVLGASVSGITVLLSKDFIKLVILAIFIASPMAWWAMDKWLQDFAFRVDIGWMAFVAAALFAVTIALFTVSFQAIKAAIANPVESLRTE